MIIFSEKMSIQFIKLKQNGIIPIKHTKSSAGFDLFSPYFCTILPNNRLVIETNIRIILPNNTYGNITARSGLAAYSGIIIGAGTIDPDFEGNISVILFNLGNTEFQIKPGDRIAQLVVIPFISCDNVHVTQLYRGTEGLGSSGQ